MNGESKKKQDPPPLEGDPLPEVFLGENKVVQRVLFKEAGLSPKFGVVVLLPSSTDKATGKTFYKPLGVVCNITTEQRNEIIKLLGGTPPCS